MAYSCVRVLFEIGHEASIRTKRTPEGFTHDWEVFVRGADNTEINLFVEKVVFHLHETFTKPKRVVKEPPYSVKESGYAGFNLPIDIYFRTDEEPKKVRFNYDLNLQPSGPSINKVQREKYVFRNPDEDLRRRLIRGGGVGVGSDASSHSASAEKSSSTISATADEASSSKSSAPQLVGKPKLGGDPAKKHKVKEHRSEEPRVSNQFQDLFGPPITKTNKVSPDPKKPSPTPKVSPLPKPVKPPDKPVSDKSSSSTAKAVKHNVQKDSRENSTSSSNSSVSKEEKKEKNKERDRSREKEKTKHPSPPKVPPISKPSKDETKKVQPEEHKVKSDSKSSGDSGKSEKKKKDKRSKDEKPKKERHKDKEHESKTNDKVDKVEKPSKESKEKDKEKDVSRKSEKDSSKEIEKSKDRDKGSGDGDKDRSRHKHKKKERSKRDESGKEKDREREKTKKTSSESKKSESKDKDKNGVPSESKKRPQSPPPSPPSSPKPSQIPEKPPLPPPTAKDKPAKRPLTQLFDELRESSDSNLSQLSEDEDSIEHPSTQQTKSPASVDNNNKSEPAVKTDIQNESQMTTNNNQTSNKIETIKSKPESANQEKYSLSKVTNNNISNSTSVSSSTNSSNNKQKDKSTSKKNKEKKESNSGGVGKDDSISKGDRDSSKKRKRKSSGKVKDDESSSGVRGEDMPVSKMPKLDHDVIKSDEQVGRIANEASSHAEVSGATVMEPAEEPQADDVFSTPAAPSTPATATSTIQFSPDYVSQLKELQRKIMTLEDNAELQRVVQVIAETGQYEITKKTFDFDLCALDRSTVKRLQDFFTTS